MTPAKPQAQPVNSSSPVNYWDAVDAWGHASEQRRREGWVMLTEQAERDAMFTAEVRGGPSLMERITPYLLFTAAALISAGVIIVIGRLNGWCQ